jgi:hypothetical protein
MKKIDITNYEEWIIDWLDGNLNDMQVDEVLQFLEEHPDLKEESGEIELFRLKPANNHFTEKNRLKKSVNDLSDTQFEHLCAASIENDLSADQMNELEEVTKQNPDRKKTLGLFGKTKLNPIELVYPHKKALYRKTVLQSTVSLLFIGLSAAAVIAIAFISYFTKPSELPVKYETISQVTVNDTSQKKNHDQKIPVKEIAGNKEHAKNQYKNKVTPIQPVSNSTAQLPEEKKIIDDSSSIRTEIQIRKIKIEPYFAYKAEVPENLISLNYTPAPVPEEEERSKIGRFIAKTIREKFLREKTPADKPLKGYEIAQAGVAGLNKIMGWEMALNERKDPEGNLKSVYFSSKLLKFNAPVKKTESPR